MNVTILTKTSTENEIKLYFQKVLELKQSHEEYPINLDDVWMLVYARKDYALRELRKNFIEGEDYKLLQNEKVVTFNELKNGITYTAILTISCLEYFIARKIRPVFEVYRQVFHKVAEPSNIPLTPAEMLLQQAQIAVEHERKISEISNDVESIKTELAEIKAKTATRPEYFTIAGYASLRGFKVGNSIAKNLGKAATAICRNKGYDIDEVTDPRWGIVGSYPVDVLNDVFEKHNFIEVKSDLANIEKFAKTRSNVNKIAKDILAPDLEDLETLPFIYDWAKSISKDIKNYPPEETTEYKQLFIYIALMLYSPRFFAGEFLIRGLRDELAKLFSLSPSHISNLCRDVSFLYRSNLNFQKNADYIIAEVLFRIRSISMEQMRESVLV